MNITLSTCPGCGAELLNINGPQHAYIGASKGCWAIFSALMHAGNPSLSPQPGLALLVDAYAAQHPGVPSRQSIQSVAVHLLSLFSVLEAGYRPDQVLWLRQRALRPGREPKMDRFTWLEPPALDQGLTIAEIAAGPDPESRTRLALAYIRDVWQAWEPRHGPTIRRWFGLHILGDSR